MLDPLSGALDSIGAVAYPCYPRARGRGPIPEPVDPLVYVADGIADATASYVQPQGHHSDQGDSTGEAFHRHNKVGVHDESRAAEQLPDSDWS